MKAVLMRLLMLLVGFALSGMPLSAEDEGERLDLATCLRLALENDPQIAVAEIDLTRAEANVLFETGTFDWTLSANVVASESRLPENEATQLENGGRDALDTSTVSYGAGVTKTFKNGLQFSQDLSVSRDDTNINGATTKTTGALDFTLTMPLLQGRGSLIVSAPLQAAGKDQEAARLDLNRRVAERIFAATSAFWQYYAAYHQHRVIGESEARSAKLVADTRSLIKAGEMPENELLQLLANDAEKRANTINAANNLFQVRQNLLVVLGLDQARSEVVQQIPAALPLAEDFDIQNLPTPERLTAFALAQRPDFLALDLRKQGDLLRQRVAEDRLKAELGLAVSAGTNTLREGSGADEMLAALTGDTPGPSYSVALRYLLPLQRSVAKSRVVAARAQVARRDIDQNDLRRRIGLEVVRAYQDLLRIHEEKTTFEESVKFYTLAVKNERRKLKLGFSTLLDMINYEDRLTIAERNMFAAQTRFWQALARLQLEIGTFQAGRAIDLRERAALFRLMAP